MCRTHILVAGQKPDEMAQAGTQAAAIEVDALGESEPQTFGENFQRMKSKDR